MENFLWISKEYRSAQSKYVTEVFPKILLEFDLIIELGTFTGAFTDWLSQNIKEECRIISIDINEEYRQIKSCRNTDFRICDCFDTDIITEIKNIIQTSGRVLFLCDGGDKETEFKLYSRFLKNNDVIMLHDYAHSDEDYENIKSIINWPTNYESSFRNISRYLEDLNLSPYYYDDFKSVLWGSFIKIN
jgi:cephalosporin hydroxylase